jgi:hypothetical protein
MRETWGVGVEVVPGAAEIVARWRKRAFWRHWRTSGGRVEEVVGWVEVRDGS